MPPDYKTLQARHEREKADCPDAFNLRIHRALSWLRHAEKMAAAADQDAQFISLWVSFNAAYASDMGMTDDRPERDIFRGFINTLCLLDCQGDRALEDIARREYARVKSALHNQYIYHPFWEWQRGNIPEKQWRGRFRGENREATTAFETGHDAFGGGTAALLNAVFSRLYTLRNQVLHGHATWDGSVNRAQIADGAAILAATAPTIIGIMLDNPGHDWPRPLYPVINTPN